MCFATCWAFASLAFPVMSEERYDGSYHEMPASDSNVMAFLSESETARALRNEVRRRVEEYYALPSARQRQHTNFWQFLMEPDYALTVSDETVAHGAISFLDVAPLLEELGRGLAPADFLLHRILTPTYLSPIDKQQNGEVVNESSPSTDVALADSLAQGCRDDSGGIEVGDYRGLALLGPGRCSLALGVEMADDAAIVMLDPTMPQFSLRRLGAYDGTRNIAIVEFDHIAVGPGAILFSGDGARRRISRMQFRAAAALGLDSIGGAKRALTIATEYARHRVQFGRPIGSYQAIRHQLVDVFLAIESARNAAYYAAWALDVGASDRDFAVSAAKVLSTEAHRRAALSAIDVHGALGFTEEAGLHRHLARATLNDALFGGAPRRLADLAELIVGGASAQVLPDLS